jgi:N-acetylglucosamine-6-phosphate deacetylase
MTMAPELRGTRELIRWCRRHRVVASLGHSASNAEVARHAVDAGATAVTHVFNGMCPLHHRHPSLVDVALTDPRLTTMVILDGIHVSPSAFRLLVRAKGPGRIALVTDSIAQSGWDVVKRHGAYYTRKDILAGSALTMMRAVRNAVERGGVSLVEAVRMATEVPARLLGDRSRGVLAVGRRADLVAFDTTFRVVLTIAGGRLVYQRA